MKQIFKRKKQLGVLQLRSREATTGTKTRSMWGPKVVSDVCVQFVDKNLHQVLCLLVTVVLGDDDYQDYNSDDVASEQLDGQEAEEHPLSHSHLHFGPRSSIQPLPSLQPALPAGPLVGSTRLGVVDHGPAVRVGHHGGVGHRHAAAGHAHSVGGHAGHDLFIVSDRANGTGSSGGKRSGDCAISYELACANGPGQAGDGKSVLECPPGEEEVKL